MPADFTSELQQVAAIARKARAATPQTQRLRDIYTRAKALETQLSAFQQAISQASTATADIEAQISRITTH